MKKIIIMCIICCLLVLNGCGTTMTTSSTDKTTEKTAMEVATNEAANSEITASAASQNSEDGNNEAGTKEIVDMAGRTVIIPKTIDSVFGANNNASIFLYTLVPERMIGWNSSLSEKSQPYLDAEAYKLPALGTLYGNSEEVNLETIIANAPDIIVFLQSDINNKMIQTADDLQKKLSIPVVMVNGDFNQYDKAYEFMGEILECEEKAGELATYCNKTYELAASVNETYSSESPVTVYYGSGDDVLTTAAKGSSQSAIIDMIGATNIVDAGTISESSKISMEELISLNPEHIILGNSGFSSGNSSENLESADGWNILTAVSKGNVYSIPKLPFNWFDKPPSVNRILGIHWLISVLYPDYDGEDIVSETKEYFDLFYNVEIKEKQIEKLLGKE